MKRGLAVITILSLALIAFSCGPSDGGIHVMDYSDATDTQETVVENADEAQPHLPTTTIMATPTVEELLNAVLELDISNSTKTTINYVLDFLPELDGWLAEIPGETLQAIDQIMSNVTEKETVAETTSFLQEAIDSGDYDAYEWLPEALEFGIDLLEDGNLTIYNPGWYPYTETPFLDEGFNVSQMWKEGLQGGIEGAVGCALADIAPLDYGVKIGGVVGAVDSSLADLIGQLADWW